MKINFGEAGIAIAAIAFGAVMAIKGSSYPIGSISMMGPGYFPILMGIITMLFGAGALAEGLREGNEMPEVPWRAFFLVFLGVLIWASTAERFGLVPASIALLVLASMARRPLHVRTMVIMTAVVTLGAVLLFVIGFNLPLEAVEW